MQTPAIDMYTPDQTCQALGLGAAAVLDLVNSGRLTAYNLGGAIRFKVRDVQVASAALVGA